MGSLGATGLVSHSPSQRTARYKAHKETQNSYQENSYFSNSLTCRCVYTILAEPDVKDSLVSSLDHS